MGNVTRLFGRLGKKGFCGLITLGLVFSQLALMAPVFADPVDLSGHITDSGTQQPIANATVSLSLGSTVFGERITDENGFYLFSVTDPVPVTFTVTVRAVGYQTDATHTANLSQSATLDVALATGLGWVTGQVIGSDTSQPVQGATVKVRKNGVVHATATTDANGAYTTSPFNSPDTYELVVYPPSASAYQLWTQSNAVSGQLTKNVSLLSGTVTMSGTVKTSDPGVTLDPTHPYQHNLLVANATVRLLKTGTQTVAATTTTDANGAYSVTFTPQDFYDIRVLPPAGQPAGGGSMIHQSLNNQLILANKTQDFSLVHQNPKISGQVTDETTHQPVEGATVELYWVVTNAVNPMTGQTFSGELVIQTVTTDGSGNYSVGGPGQLTYQGRFYYVKALAPGAPEVTTTTTALLQDTTQDLELDMPDTTPPEISYTLDPELPASGWYKSPVTLTWSVEDNQSSITNQTGCDLVTVNSDTDSDGTDYTCSATSQGGTAQETATIKYDATAPTMGSPAWSPNSVNVGSTTSFMVTASDSLSGVTAGEYFIGSDPGQGSATALTWDGTNLSSAPFGANLALGNHTISIRAKDAAGNWSSVITTQLVVQDVTPPVVTYTLSTPPNANGWHKANVTINWLSNDPDPSSGTPTDPTDTVATTESQNVNYTSASSCDPAGNCATGSAQVSLDKTLPTLSTFTPTTNPLVVFGSQNFTISATDALSGVQRVEYYYDNNDPGQGNATTMTLSSGSTYNGVLNTGTSFLPSNHNVRIRALDSAGNWSTLFSKAFTEIF
jgi:hypothetical protein